jgi:hypothetical protein
MMETDASRALFERVLEALNRAEGDSMALMAAFTTLDQETRALALIRALLSAEDALRATFAAEAAAQREGALARRAALALAISADALEATTPDRNPVRLSEMPLGRAAF